MGRGSRPAICLAAGTGEGPYRPASDKLPAGRGNALWFASDSSARVVGACAACCGGLRLPLRPRAGRCRQSLYRTRRDEIPCDGHGHQGCGVVGGHACLRLACGSGIGRARLGRRCHACRGEQREPLRRAAQFDHLHAGRRSRRARSQPDHRPVRTCRRRAHDHAAGDLRRYRKRPYPRGCTARRIGDAGEERSRLHAAARIRGRPGRLVVADRSASPPQIGLAAFRLFAGQAAQRDRGGILPPADFGRRLENRPLPAEPARAGR